MPTFKQDLSDSAFDFLRVVWPSITIWLGKGDIIPVETTTGPALTQMLDQYSGIDAWHVSVGKQIRGVASRVQWVEKRGWDTFTVRYLRDSGAKTEYAKRKEAIEAGQGWIYPHFAVQAYIATPPRVGDLLSVAVSPTTDIIALCDWILENAPNEENKGYGIRRTSNAQFFYLSWDWIRQCGFTVKIHREPARTQTPRAARTLNRPAIFNIAS